MGVTVGVNNRSVVHKDSAGVTLCFPDVCKTQCGPPVIPIPYPNVAKSSDTDKGTKKVTCDGNSTCIENSNFSKSVGDQPGALKGIVSSTVGDIAEFLTWSMDVKFEGKHVPRALDIMLHNKKNTPPFPVLQMPIIVVSKEEKAVCLFCEKPLD